MAISRSTIGVNHSVSSTGSTASYSPHSVQGISTTQVTQAWLTNQQLQNQISQLKAQAPAVTFNVLTPRQVELTQEVLRMQAAYGKDQTDAILSMFKADAQAKLAGAMVEVGAQLALIADAVERSIDVRHK